MRLNDVLRRAARRTVNGTEQICTGPLRSAGTRLAHRFPSSTSRLGQWSWLWQPGWSRRWHNHFYGTGEDPYHFGSNPYEQAKYRRLLDALGAGSYARALEVGCAQGAFTEMLLPYCGDLVAVDLSETALARAMRRLEGQAGVRFERRTLPFDCPDGPFDLIVCADVLYYWPRATLAFGLRRLQERLAPGGELLLLHYLGSFGQATPGAEVHRLAGETAIGEPPLMHRHGNLWAGIGPGGAGYRLDLFVKQ